MSVLCSCIFGHLGVVGPWMKLAGIRCRSNHAGHGLINHQTRCDATAHRCVLTRSRLVNIVFNFFIKTNSQNLSIYVYIYIFSKTKAWIIIFRCLKYPYFKWFKSYDRNHIFFEISGKFWKSVSTPNSVFKWHRIKMIFLNMFTRHFLRE